MIQEFLSFRGSETRMVIIHFPAWFWFHIHAHPTHAVDKTDTALAAKCNVSFFCNNLPCHTKRCIKCIHKCAKCWFASDPHLLPQPFPHHFLQLFSDAMVPSHVSTSQAVPLSVSALLVTGPGHSGTRQELRWLKRKEGDLQFPTWSNQILSAFQPFCYVGVWMCNVDHAQLYIMVQVLHKIFWRISWHAKSHEMQVRSTAIRCCKFTNNMISRMTGCMTWTNSQQSKFEAFIAAIAISFQGNDLAYHHLHILHRTCKLIVK